MENDVLAKITFIVSNVRWNSRAPAVLLSRSVEKSVDARRDGFPDSAQVGPPGSGNLSPFGNGFKFCSRTFSTGLLGDIIFPERLGQVFNFFYWTTRRDYFSKCFRKDSDTFSTFSIGLLEEIIFPSVSGKTRTRFQLFLLDYSKRLFFQVFPERLGQVFNFFYWTPRRLQRVCISFRLQRVQRRGRLRLLSNPPEWTLTPFTRKLLFIVEKMESLGVSIVPASIVLEFLVVNGLCHRF
jgi:hypothetical protein